MIVKHACYENNWFNPIQLPEIKTLILGSFNPHNPINGNTDYYYGRESNFLWKEIALILGKSENFFQNSMKRKFEIMNEFNFGFLDVIGSIQIHHKTDDKISIQNFVNEHIFTNYFDSKLFTSHHRNSGIKITRNYNLEILDIIHSKKVNKVIHTMGNNRISLDYVTQPLEKDFGSKGFQGFINLVRETGVDFVKESYSPSGYAVNTGGADYRINLKKWLTDNLFS